MPSLLAPDVGISAVAGPSKSAKDYKKRTGFAPTSFRTLDREKAFINPSSVETKYSAPQELVAPHIHSFDALFEGAPTGPGGAISQSEGLMHLGIKDLLPKVVFDRRMAEDASEATRLESASFLLHFLRTSTR
jgi:DNA-directed RNA polymerase I subunit RPA2